MKKIIINTIILFVINFTLTGLTKLFFVEQGEIIMSSNVLIDSATYSKTILINNFKKKSISGLEFRGTNGNIIKLYSDNNLEYEITTAGASQKVTIKNIYPSTNNTVTFILKPNSQREPNIVPINHFDSDLNLYESGTLKWNYLKFIIETSINSFLIAMIGMIGYYFIDLKMNELSEKLANAKIETEKASIRTSKLDERLNSFIKFRIVYLARLRDFSKENRFYKNLIQSFFKNSNPKISDEKFNELITKELKTFLTHQDAEKEIESFETLNKLFTDSNAR